MRRARFDMSRVSLLVLVCTFATLVDVATATCTSSKYEEGIGERLQCSNVTLSAVVNYNGPIIGAIMIFRSRINAIPDRSFLRYAKSLMSLNMNDCGIAEISPNAFDGLTYLKKLGLSYNNVTSVRNQWFVSLISLEQLDLSHNLIESIEPTVFEKLRGLRRLDVGNNRLTCLEPAQLVPMVGMEKLRFAGNPLTFRCRGTLTLWLQDLGINYKTEQRGEDNWLDSILWLCAADDGKIADSEILMKECVILNLFNQLRTGLTTSDTFPQPVSQECVYARNELTRCIVTDRKRNKEVTTNGHVVRKLLRHLKEAK